ncbi:ELMO domain-containing protein A-like isoform X2 [Cucumis melo var. makuwa]|uniref:ELMO domain-containing protein A-like isoform X2 n=1 Tax=Cucumis melo var. makuwa TaxID=1194695 RepID=A0A5D3DM44_CUCMM|nr:ELMO domain-containing protein A-like isoform X2 [Cucumis melo var. makuwa]
MIFRIRSGNLLLEDFSRSGARKYLPFNFSSAYAEALTAFMLAEIQICFAEVVAGSAAWLGRGLSCVCAQRRESDARPSFDLTPAQEECLQRLQNRIDIAYDSSITEHQEALRTLWNVAFPEEELRGLISEQWKEMGWQGKDPSTDFRGGGFISLENLLFFAKNFPKSFQDLLRKQEGDRSLWEYPFAVAGVNITFMLIQMLDLEAGLLSL